MKTQAIVSYPPADPTAPKPNYKLETLTISEELAEDELLVEKVSSGICQSDNFVASLPPPYGSYPRVLGHEGAGYVRKIGKNVTIAKPGDAVILSYSSCGSCQLCDSNHLSYCPEFSELNGQGIEDSFQLEKDGETTNVRGRFFGQSSFAQLSKCGEASVTNVTQLVKSEEELKLFSPLGCGNMTGCGTVLNTAKLMEKDTVVVAGIGGVGLSSIMAAKIAGCKTIIGVDLVQSRIDMAKELGATHAFSPNDKNIIEAVKEIIPLGTSVFIDTTGLPDMLEKGLECVAPRGRVFVVGLSKPGAEMKINLTPFLTTGKAVQAACMGDATPREFIPKMIEWYHAGKFPVDKLVKYFPIQDFEKAFEGMRDGSAIKPVLVWPSKL